MGLTPIKRFVRSRVYLDIHRVERRGSSIRVKGSFVNISVAVDPSGDLWGSYDDDP